MPALTPGDGQDLLARFKGAWERRDVDRMMTLFREDAEFRPDPFEPPLMGDLAIREWWNTVAASQANVEFDAERVWVTGTTVLASWHAATTDRASADRIRHRGFSTFELDGDRTVTRCRQWVASRTVGIDGTFSPEREPGPGGSDGR